MRGTISSTSTAKSEPGTKNYCYTALLQKQSGITDATTVYAAIFIQITAPEGASEAAIKNFGRGKANMQTKGYQIFKETVELDKQCTDCKKEVSATYTLSDFIINNETMR